MASSGLTMLWEGENWQRAKGDAKLSLNDAPASCLPGSLPGTFESASVLSQRGTPPTTHFPDPECDDELTKLSLAPATPSVPADESRRSQRISARGGLRWTLNGPAPAHDAPTSSRKRRESEDRSDDEASATTAESASVHDCVDPECAEGAQALLSITRLVLEDSRASKTRRTSNASASENPAPALLALSEGRAPEPNADGSYDGELLPSHVLHDYMRTFAQARALLLWETQPYRLLRKTAAA